jgi:hypothetical protein
MRCNRTVEHIVVISSVISHALQHRKRPARVRTVPNQAHAQGTNHPEIDALLNLMCAQECISLKANSSNSEVGAERASPHAALAPIRIT